MALRDFEVESPAAKELSNKLPLSEQEKVIATLHEAISMLEDKLYSVLSPSEPENTTSGEDPVRSLSPLAEQLYSNNLGISRAGTRLYRLMERIEC